MLSLAVVVASAQMLSEAVPLRRVGQYTIFTEIASGGMATVYFGRLLGAAGFSRPVAIKQLHPQYARSPEFVAQFLDEATLSARIRHPNVISVLDVVTSDGELFVVMPFVPGETLSRLARGATEPIPMAIVSAILVQTLLGLHAAHEATTEHGAPLQLVHRDVSPQNVLVGADGTAHVLDFGIAKAVSRLHTTKNGKVKGKVAYMPPEQLRGAPLDRRADVYAAGVVLWEALTRQRLFARSNVGSTAYAVLAGDVSAPSQHRPEVDQRLDALVLRALAASPDDRFATARDMAIELEHCVPPASNIQVGDWVMRVAGSALEERAARLRDAEEVTIHPEPDTQAQLRALHEPTPSGAVATAAPALAAATGPGFGGPRAALRRSVLGLAALGLAMGAALLIRPGGERSSASQPPPRAPAIPIVSASNLPFENSEPRPDVSDLAATVPASPAARSAGRLGATSTSAVRKVRTARPDLLSCATPYVIVENGRRKFKPECFR